MSSQIKRLILHFELKDNNGKSFKEIKIGDIFNGEKIERIELQVEFNLYTFFNKKDQPIEGIFSPFAIPLNR